MRDYSNLVLSKQDAELLSHVLFIENSTDGAYLIPPVEGKTALDQLLEAGATIEEELR